MVNELYKSFGNAEQKRGDRDVVSGKERLYAR